MDPRLMSEQSASEHADRYEALRRRVMERAAADARHGLAVLLYQGVAGWMDACTKLPAPPPRSAKDINPRPCPLPTGGSRTELVRVLTAMTLGHMQEVHA